jgi:hypothetical protein
MIQGAPELQQCVPVTAVASQARRLDRNNGTDAPVADGSQQLLEAKSHNAAAGAAKIVVDDGDIASAELQRAHLPAPSIHREPSGNCRGFKVDQSPMGVHLRVKDDVGDKVLVCVSE